MRNFLVLIIGGVISLILLAVAGWYYKGGSAAVDDAKSSYTTQLDTVTKLRAPKMFPSEKNVAERTTEQTEIMNIRETYAANLFKTPIRPLLSNDPAQNPGREFLKTLNNKSKRWMKRADSLPGGGRIFLPLPGAAGSTPTPGSKGVAAEFDEDNPYLFGFQSYEDGSAPTDDKAPRLSVQLQCIEMLVDTLFSAPIEELESIRRNMEFDIVDPKLARRGRGAPTVSSPRGRGAAPAAKGAKGAPAAAVIEEAEALYTTERFTLRFICKEAALWQVMNTLNTQPYPVTVKFVSVLNLNEAFTPENLGNSAAGSAFASDLGFFEQTAGVGDDIEELKFVTGLESIKILLVVDVYRLPDPKPKTEASATATKETP